MRNLVVVCTLLALLAVIAVSTDDETCNAPADFVGGKRRRGGRRRTAQKPYVNEDEEKASQTLYEANGDEGVPAELLAAIACPACDYTAAYLVKQALDAQRKCGRRPFISTSDAVKSDEGMEVCIVNQTSHLLMASKRSIGQIFDKACSEGVLRAMPIGSRAAPRKTEDDTRPDDIRLNDLKTFKPEPADDDYRKAITFACRPNFDGLTKTDRLNAKRLLFDLTVDASEEGPRWDKEDKESGGAIGAKELYERRNLDYQRILRYQEGLCRNACGDMVRPEAAPPNPPLKIETFSKPRAEDEEAASYLGMVSWNAFGEIVPRDFI